MSIWQLVLKLLTQNGKWSFVYPHKRIAYVEAIM